MILGRLDVGKNHKYLAQLLAVRASSIKDHNKMALSGGTCFYPFRGTASAASDPSQHGVDVEQAREIRCPCILGM